MKKRIRVRSWPAVIALAAVALLAGCSSDTCTCPEDVDDTGYPDQSTPDNVIEKLEMAYENLDGDAYMECLAADFIFFLNPDDVEADSTLPPYWDKAEERRMVEHMFADTTAIGSIDLTLTVVSRDSLPGADPDDPSDDLWEYEVDVDLTVEAGLTYLSSGMSLFVMRRSPDHLETTWQIIEHHDLGDDGIQRESTTWTTIKLVFGGPATDSLYPLRTSAESVLRKLVLAYERMDADAYLDCLAEELTFYLNPEDVWADPTLPEHWGKQEETAIHSLMFGETTDVLEISLTMDVISDEHDPGPDPVDPSDDRWTVEVEADLWVWLPGDLALRADHPQEFVIAVDPDETGHGGSRLWEVLAWYDLSPWRPTPGRVWSSWGGIKAMYR
jgi:hypothetical protein